MCMWDICGDQTIPWDLDIAPYHVLFSKTWSWLESSDILPGLETCNIATCHVWSGTKHYRLEGGWPTASRMFDVNIVLTLMGHPSFGR
jgi:hypothetical protein